MTLARSAVAALVVLALFAGAGAAAPTGGHEQADAGPPSDLPGPVPDFVGDILNTIQQFLDGALEGVLGPAVSGDAGANTTTADATGG